MPEAIFLDSLWISLCHAMLSVFSRIQRKFVVKKLFVLFKSQVRLDCIECKSVLAYVM